MFISSRILLCEHMEFITAILCLSHKNTDVHNDYFIWTQKTDSDHNYLLIELHWIEFNKVKPLEKLSIYISFIH